MRIKAVVFDVGRTLMEYIDMPNSWLDYYAPALHHVREVLNLPVSDEMLDKSIEIYRSYSPQVKPREKDFTPEEIFSDVTKGWSCEFNLSDVIEEFFAYMDLKPYIYPDTVPILEKLRSDGYIVCTLTDVATGMPDELHKSYFPELLSYFDMYVSSITCGYRKPSAKGLEIIAERYNLKPGEIVVIGDEPKDVMTAKRFGCPSVLIDRAGEKPDFGQDYSVSDLNGFYELLKTKLA
ncbi:MAG: HAD family hydrolase [Ruminococcus sp.]|nr:HAD family hydrolase [Ruminococcus sp.]